MSLLLVMLVACVTEAADRPVPRTTPPIAVLVKGEKRSADLKQAATQVVQGTNALRRKEGREALNVNPQLTAAAEYFAGFMARTERYSHEADGLKPSQRVASQGYKACMTAENLAYQYISTGFSTDDLAQSLVNGWMDSPGHRANMLDKDITEIGVAIARSTESGKYYAVQEFGRPQALKLEFAIRNDAGVAVRYSVGEEAFPLPNGTTATHMACRPTTLVFRWPGKQAPTEISVITQQQYLITRSGDGAFRVEQSPRSSGRTP